ncbi:MAG: hypothetical protein M1587_03910 [Thaumarchaeota archaeon]|nr:hypothetical protein [Nitrososphaerota archaeon]
MIIFFFVLIVYLFEDIIPPWRNAIPLGSYEIWLAQRATRLMKRRKRNFVDLTDMVFDKKDGVSLMQTLIEGMKDPGFKMPNEQREIFLDALNTAIKVASSQELIKKKGYPLIETSHHRLIVLGMGSTISRAEVVVALVNKKRSFPEDYVWGQSKGVFRFSGWRSRKYIIARQFYFPKKMKNFLGKRRIRISAVFFTDPFGDEDVNERIEMMESMKQLTTDVVPMVTALAEHHIMQDKLKVANRLIVTLQNQVDAAKQAGFTNLAGGNATNSAMDSLSQLTGGKNRPIRGAISPMVIIVGAVGGDVIFQYGFSTNPLWGVFIGSLLALFITVKR